MSNRTSGSKKLNAGLLARVANGMSGMLSVVRGDTWFSPGEPLTPQEQRAKRITDYNISTNINYAPKVDEGVTFEKLRNFANYDIVRLAIETRKDQMGSLSFSIQPKKDKKVAKLRIKKVADALTYPDRQRPWSTWLRLLVEDLLVIDAPTISPWFNRSGGLYALEVFDGATIHRVIDAAGRTPFPIGTDPLRKPVTAEVAYQQILYGIVACDFARDQLIYMPRNPRTHKMYGFSPVEQILQTIDIAIRRRDSQKAYFTDGSIPNLFLTTPANWSPDEVRSFETYINETMSGNVSAKRQIKAIPDGMKPVPVKEVDLKTEYDEWLARIVCFCFSLPPTPFIKQINRSTAEAAQQTALEEGLAPLKQWVKEVMDYIIVFYFKEPDLEFTWEADEIEQDPLTKATIQDMKVKNSTLTVDEARLDDGRPALTEEQKADIATANGTAPTDDEPKSQKQQQTQKQKQGAKDD